MGVTCYVLCGGGLGYGVCACAVTPHLLMCACAQSHNDGLWVYSCDTPRATTRGGHAHAHAHCMRTAGGHDTLCAARNGLRRVRDAIDAARREGIQRC